jgi:hypothetical protein
MSGKRMQAFIAVVDTILKARSKKGFPGLLVLTKREVGAALGLDRVYGDTRLPQMQEVALERNVLVGSYADYDYFIFLDVEAFRDKYLDEGAYGLGGLNIKQQVDDYESVVGSEAEHQMYKEFVERVVAAEA